MFTGIISEIGEIKRLRRRTKGGEVEVRAGRLLDDYGEKGESIAVNGACLTVTERRGDAFTADLSEETFERTAFLYLREGSRVNLEKPVTLNDVLGGHLVQGHVDCVGEIVSVIPEGGAFNARIEVQGTLPGCLVDKGSVAVDGISLTVASLHQRAFEVALIPQTIQATTASLWKSGVHVNIEYDIIGKYVESVLGKNPTGEGRARVTPEFLKNHGFLD